MNIGISAIFIRRPVATTLLTIGIALAGAFAFGLLPVSPLPQIDFATISVNATMPGGEPRPTWPPASPRRSRNISARSPTSPK